MSCSLSSLVSPTLKQLEACLTIPESFLLRRWDDAACRSCAIDDAANPSDDSKTAPDRGGAREAYRPSGSNASVSIERWLG
jgi:hypothetical protein